MTTYKITRFFRESDRRDVVAEGITKDEAKAHCSGPEASSATATSAEAKKLTAEAGEWFDGWTVDEEDDDEP